MFKKTNPLLLELVTTAAALSVIGLFLSVTIDLLALHTEYIIKTFIVIYWSLFIIVLVYVVIQHMKNENK